MDMDAQALQFRCANNIGLARQMFGYTCPRIDNDKKRGGSMSLIVTRSEDLGLGQLFCRSLTL